MAQLTTFAVSLAALYDLFQVKGVKEDLITAREYSREYRDSTLRLSALIKGDEDPEDGVKYGPIGSAAYSTTKHAQFTLQQARALTATLYYLEAAHQKMTRAMYAAIGAAGVWALDPATTNGLSQVGPVFSGMGEYGAPLAIGALALGVYNFESADDREFCREVKRAGRGRKDAWGLDPLG